MKQFLQLRRFYSNDKVVIAYVDKHRIIGWGYLYGSQYGTLYGKMNLPELSIYVASTYRKRGVGHNIFNRLMKIAQDKNINMNSLCAQKRVSKWLNLSRKNKRTI
jgi:L-amino acid N-acyltransferase YncA